MYVMNKIPTQSFTASNEATLANILNITPVVKWL